MNVMKQSWKGLAEKAEHYLAIGQSEIYLDSSAPDYPWQFVVKVEPGGSHRLDIATSVWFTAQHESGLSFRWTFEIEPMSANGKGSYEIDAEACRAVFVKLPPEAAKSFAAYLADCAVKVKSRADEYQAIATRQYQDAMILNQLSQR